MSKTSMNKKLKLCLIAPVPPPYGGIGNWLLLIRKYIKTRDDVEAKVINIAPVGRSLDGRTIWDRVVSQGILMLKKRKELIKLIKNNRPDVIHITTSGQLAAIRDILLLKVAKRHKVPTVYHINFGRIKEIAETKTREWKLISKALKLASLALVIDQRTYDAIKKHLPEVNVIYLPMPIDLSNLPSPKETDSKTIIYVGWLVKTKGIEELLTAWTQVFNRNKDWELRIAGPAKPEYLASLKERFSFEGVIYDGELKHDEAMERLNDSSMLILPSYTEGFPNVILEAMALRKPVIATDVGAIPEILCNECGLLIKAKNTEEIEKAIEDLISNSDKRKQLSENAYKKLNNEFTIDIIFKKYMEEWQKISNKGEK